MRVALAIVLCSSLLACTGTPTPPSPVKNAKRPAAASRPAARAPVVTDKDHYAMVEGPYGPQTLISTTLTAPADVRLYITNCNGSFSTGLQQRLGAEWKDVWSPAMNACLSPPIIIEPGRSLTTSITPFSGAHGAVDSTTDSSRIDGGTYRVVWHGVLTSFNMDQYPFGEELPIEQRASAPITISAPEPAEKRLTATMPRPREIVEVTPSHNAIASGGDPVRVRFSFREAQLNLAGDVQLYIDRQWMSEKMTTSRTGDVPPSQLEIEYEPDRPWTPGRHYARVIYNDTNRRTHWYAWSFVVK